MEEKKKIIKDDINFLEYPNWTVSKKNNITYYSIEKPNGKYEVICHFGLPKHFDKIVFYFLLHKLYHDNQFSSHTLITNRYEIAKNIFDGNHFGKTIYDRIMKAVRKWQSILINFKGLFYGEDSDTERGFSIISEYVLQKSTGELKITFSDSYIKQLQNTKFYKLIDFEQYKKLHKTSSARLYEILIKNFKERKEWSIGMQLLAEKLTFEKRKGSQRYYSSDVLRYVKPGVNEINKKTDLSISFEYNKETDVCIFKEISKQKENYTATATIECYEKHQVKVNAQQKKACMKKFNALSDDEQKTILNGIANEPFLKFLKNREMQIYAYMTRHDNEIAVDI